MYLMFFTENRQMRKIFNYLLLIDVILKCHHITFNLNLRLQYL